MTVPVAGEGWGLFSIMRRMASRKDKALIWQFAFPVAVVSALTFSNHSDPVDSLKPSSLTHIAQVRGGWTIKHPVNAKLRSRLA